MSIIATSQLETHKRNGRHKMDVEMSKAEPFPQGKMGSSILGGTLDPKFMDKPHMIGSLQNCSAAGLSQRKVRNGLCPSSPNPARRNRSLKRRDPPSLSPFQPRSWAKPRGAS